MSALSTRLTLMADELVFQKRMAVVQSTLLLFCLGLVLFVRSGSSSLELPLMQQVLTKSHSMIRQPSEYSPPGSPSSRDTSPRFKARRKFGRGVGNDADAGSMSPPSRSAEDRRVRTLGMVTPSDADEELMRDPDQLAANGLDDAQSVAGPRFSELWRFRSRSALGQVLFTILAIVADRVCLAGWPYVRSWFVRPEI